jgi:hypothetical protein
LAAVAKPRVKPGTAVVLDDHLVVVARPRAGALQAAGREGVWGWAVERGDCRGQRDGASVINAEGYVAALLIMTHRSGGGHRCRRGWCDR